MRNIVLHLKFDGARYHGWQVQQNAVTVQQTVQDAVERVFHTRLGVTGCSRTDTGVHANDYVCCIRTETAIPPVSIAFANRKSIDGRESANCRRPSRPRRLPAYLSQRFSRS